MLIEWYYISLYNWYKACVLCCRSSYAANRPKQATGRRPPTAQPNKQWQSKNKVYKPPREVATAVGRLQQSASLSSLTSHHRLPLDHSTPQGTRPGPSSKLYLPPKPTAVQQTPKVNSLTASSQPSPLVFNSQPPPHVSIKTEPLTHVNIKTEAPSSPPSSSIDNTWKSILPLGSIKAEPPSSLPSKGYYRPPKNRRKRSLGQRSASKAKRKWTLPRSGSGVGGVSSSQRLVLNASPDPGQRLVLNASPGRVVIAVPPPETPTVGSLAVSAPTVVNRTASATTVGHRLVLDPTVTNPAAPVIAVANPPAIPRHTTPSHPTPPTTTTTNRRPRRRKRGRRGGKGNHTM